MKKIIALELAAILTCAVSAAIATENGNNPSPARPGQVGPAIAASTPATMPSPGMAALAKAATDKKYLFVFFYKADDTNTQPMKKVFDETLAKSTDKANSIAIDIGDNAEKSMVAKFGVAKAPMPLALAIAPNGAVTGGFPRKFEEKDLTGAFVSPGKEKCLKVLQSGKLLIVCAQNKNTKSNDDANKGVNDFMAEKRYGMVTEVVQVDPADAAEIKLMTEFKIDPQTKEAVTVLMAPPGTLVTTVQGKVEKDKLISVLVSPPDCGCGPGGCH
jgi:hypothetical protein